MKLSRSKLFENGAIAVASVLLGLMAGFFYTYSFNVNLALLQVDGETYATVQSLLNQNVRHAGFFVCFFGAGGMSLVAAAVNFRRWREASFWLVAIAGVMYVFGVIVFTRQVNLPLNAYTESWSPSALPVDWEAIRTQWNQANAVRVWVSLSSFCFCLAALVLRASVQRKT